MVIIATLAGDQSVANVKNTEPINGEWTRQPFLAQQAGTTPARNPGKHDMLPATHDLPGRRIGNAGHGLETLLKPALDLRTPLAPPLHTGIEQRGILMIEGYDGGDIVGVKC